MHILFEDNHLLIINKEPGEIVQGDKTGDAPLVDRLKDYLKEKYHKPGNVFLGLVHRLDRPVSGAVIFARTGKALSRMNELVKSREIRKIYWAIVAAMPPQPEATLIHYLKKNEAQNRSYAYPDPAPDRKKAELHYRLLGTSDRYHLLEVELLTGRHHQIRAQLAAIGCPIRGDLKYGYPRSNPDASISLHARKLEFVHPVKQEIVSIIAPPPEDKLWKYFEEKSLQDLP